MLKAVFLTSAFAAAAVGAASQTTCFGNSSNGVKIHKLGQWPSQRFKTVSYQPPQLKIKASGDPLAPGLLFIAPDNKDKKNMPEPGPVIMTSAGEMVWHSTKPIRANNFRAQTYKGKPVLTYWDGAPTIGDNIGHGYGSIFMLDSSYKQIANICPNIKIATPGPQKYRCHLDLHEAQITSRNTMLATAYNMRPADLTSVGGSKKGYVFSGVFVELDPDTNKVLFQWDSLDHVPVGQSQLNVTTQGTKAAPFDYFHINSVQLVGGNYLVNSRNTWTSYLISPAGKIIWQFDGQNGGDFGPLPKGGNFRFSHYARIQSVGAEDFTYSIFNNNNTPGKSYGPTLGMEFTLPNKPGTKKVVLNRVVGHSPPITSDVEGDYSPTIGTSGNQLLGYGDEPYLAEFNKAGKQIWTAQFGRRTINYRAFKTEWHATPDTTPNLHVDKKNLVSLLCKKAFVSWNGATDIDGYMVYGGKSKKALVKLGKIARHGFETEFNIDSDCVQAVAMRGNKQIRSSNVVCK